MIKITPKGVLLSILMTLIFTTGQTQNNNISPYLFGQNLWLTSGSEGRTGYIDQLWPQVQQSGARIIRIGGNGYNRNMPDDATLDKWVKDIKSIGAEPLMQVSAYQSAEESARLVRHFNEDPKTRVRFWAIGNEPYHMAKMSVDSISAYIKKHASAMKEVDPSIKIQVPDLAAYYNEAYEALLLDDKLSIAGRDQNGNWYADGINFHNYPNAKDYTRSDVIFYSVSKMRGMVQELKKDLEAANAKYGRFGKDKLQWSLTEFNITYDNPDDLSVEGIAVPSFINGQFWVDIFCMAMEYGAFTVTPWCIQESDRPSTYFGYIGGPPEFTPHATFYHMQLLSRYMKGEFIKVHSGNPYLKVFGAKHKDGATLVIMNQDETRNFSIDLTQLSGKPLSGSIKLTASQKIAAKEHVIIDANSTQLLTFDKKGNILSHIIYTLEMAKNNLAPKEEKIEH